MLSSNSALDNELRDNRIDAASCCDYTGSADKDGAIQAKIECVTNEEEAKYAVGYCKSKVSHMYQNEGTVTFYIEVNQDSC